MFLELGPDITEHTAFVFPGSCEIVLVARKAFSCFLFRQREKLKTLYKILVKTTYSRATTFTNCSVFSL